MKKIILVILAGILIASCGNEESGKVKLEDNEKVVTSFANGTPQIVRTLEERDGKMITIYEKEYYEDGNLLKEGPVIDNKRHGYWKTYYRSGTLWNEGLFYEGMRDDTIKGYYPDGTIKYRGIYNNGDRTGVWLFFDEEGNLTENKVYMQPGEIREDSLYITQ